MFIKIPLAWLQLTRKKSRLLAAMAGIAFADILMFMQLGFQDALYESNTQLHKSLQGDLFLINPQSQTIAYMESFSRRRLYQARGFDNVESVNSFYVDFIRFKNPETRYNRTILFLGFNPNERVLKLPGIPENINKIKLPDVVLLDSASRPEFGTMAISEKLKQGQIVSTEMGGHKIKVGGLFKLGNSFAADGNLIASDLTFLRIFKFKNRNPEQIDIGLITLKPGSDTQKVKANLVANLPQDVRVLTKQEFVDFEQEHWASSTPIGFIFSLGVMMGFLVGAVIVYQILYTGVSDHLAEYATLKAMGYADIYFLGVVLQEALILAILGYTPGFILSVFLYDFAQNATLLPIVMNVYRASGVLISTIFMCSIASAFAIVKLRSADPSDIF
ncbi:FtsX-like permease family protein [Nostoc sp. C052]|uniref:ABC transporter permease DevC n=1 Tax=Nostoc sp. C052 TaxID=2576902 RepID=UPI0015C3DA41|nr:ABC transporter permease DevC [Nostoc sp. C052]QLE41078.1 FtsX-like permease family protein [Nostoc sp. C052]